MSAIDDLVAQLLANRLSDRVENLRADVDNFVLALQQSQNAYPFVPGGRLSLQTGQPFGTSNTTLNLFYVPYLHNTVPIWNGTLWVPTAMTLAQLQNISTDAATNPVACVASKIYDLFIWSNAGVMTLSRGLPWQVDNQSRDVGCTVSKAQGFWKNDFDIANGPKAGFGLYVGTVRTNGVSRFIQQNGANQGNGGGASILGVWNMYNRALTTTSNCDTTDTWAYTTAVVRVKNNSGALGTGNAISFIIGQSEPYYVDAVNVQNGQHSTGAGAVVGISSLGGVGSGQSMQAATGVGGAWGFNTTLPDCVFFAGKIAMGVGFDGIVPTEYAVASGAMTWWGDNGAANNIAASMFTASLMM